MNDRQRNGQADRGIDRPTDIFCDKQREILTDIFRDRQIERDNIKTDRLKHKNVRSLKNKGRVCDFE